MQCWLLKSHMRYIDIVIWRESELWSKTWLTNAERVLLLRSPLLQPPVNTLIYIIYYIMYNIDILYSSQLLIHICFFHNSAGRINMIQGSPEHNISCLIVGIVEMIEWHPLIMMVSGFHYVQDKIILLENSTASTSIITLDLALLYT